VAISDRQNRHFRIGVGNFSDRPEFGRQSRQFLSAKSEKIGESARSADRRNRGKFHRFGKPIIINSMTQLNWSAVLYHVQVITIIILFGINFSKENFWLREVLKKTVKF